MPRHRWFLTVQIMGMKWLKHASPVTTTGAATTNRRASPCRATMPATTVHLGTTITTTTRRPIHTGAVVVFCG